MSCKVAEVIIDIPHGEVDRVFDYLIPPDLLGALQPGCRVQVPFGRNNRSGFVWQLKEESTLDNIKTITGAESTPVLNQVQMALVQWLVENYFCFHITALQAVIPPEIARDEIPREKRVYCNPSREKKEWGRAYRQKEVWDYLQEIDFNPSLVRLKEATGVSSDTIQTMVERNIIEIRRERGRRDPLAPRPEKPEVLNGAIDYQMKSHLRPGRAMVYRGVAGKETWNRFIPMIQACLNNQRSAIVLAPEAMQAYFLARYLIRFFPRETLLLHSDLSPQERYDQWEKSKKRPARLIVGTRSAIFAPVENPGLIIINNEEDEAYRQRENPRYITSEVAARRAQLEKAFFILSSSSPSLSAFYGVRRGKYSFFCHSSPDRLSPEIEIVDMRKEFSRGNISIFSREVLDLLQQVAVEGRGRLFFHVNRRGYAPFVLCRNCGYVASCSKCGKNMTLHRENKQLICHHCQKKARLLEICPACKSKFIRSLGIGTEKVAEEISRLHPDLDLKIVDSDRVGKNNSLQEICRELEQGKYQVVVGTSLILKDFFPRFEGGVMVMADTDLNLPFYDSQEDFFQVINSSARRVQGGKLFIQTYNKDHPTLLQAQKGDWEGFMGRELKFREEYRYPPAWNFLAFYLEGNLNTEVEQAGRKLARVISRQVSGQRIDVLGPVPAFFPREKDKSRWQLLCRSRERRVLIRAEKEPRGMVRELLREGIAVNLELNPKRML